jgi:hypothetical protein
VVYGPLHTVCPLQGKLGQNYPNIVENLKLFVLELFRPVHLILVIYHTYCANNINSQRTGIQ